MFERTRTVMQALDSTPARVKSGSLGGERFPWRNTESPRDMPAGKKGGQERVNCVTGKLIWHGSYLVHLPAQW